MSKKRLPFGWSPSHWGLKGKLREVAKAEYELEGEALERELLRINLAGRTEEEVARVSLQLDLKYGHIDHEAHDRALLNLRKDQFTEKEFQIEELKIDQKYGKLDEEEFKKAEATVLEEPYVRFTQIHTDPNNPANGSIALDYNQAFVAHLEAHGYGPAPHPEQIVDQWFTELCKNIALETFDGIGDFNERIKDIRQQNQSDVIYRKDLKERPKQND